MWLLEAGVTVSRTAADLVRYHGKMMLVDQKVLHIYGFNFTRLDVEKSRSFGVITKNEKLVTSASRLFEADFERQPYMPSSDRLVVSPENARERLATFIKGARRQLLIYDTKVSDDAMLRIITAKMNAGVEVKIIGRVEAKWHIPGEKFPGKRLHIRAMIRDGKQAFVGSQSLRRLELDKRREIGVIIHDRIVVGQMMEIFLADWSHTEAGRREAKKAEKRERKEEKLAKAS
jgi:phosphatidylserine/phosphatidylglycerophosphate/cardiolipin synthase-like enzyme